MDKTLLGIMGAVGALVTGAAAQAAPSRPAILEAASYSDLLKPIPSAKAALEALEAQENNTEAPVELAQYFYVPPPVYWRHHHFYHHHDYAYWRRRYLRHHHHHHHHRYP